MDHASRMDLASRVMDSLRSRHPDIVAVAVYGSTAKGEDRENSDLEMSVYTEGEPEMRSYFLIHLDIVIEVTFSSREEAQKKAREVHSWWPMDADGWANYSPLYDPESLLPELAALATELDPQRFSVALHGAFVRLYEVLCKMRNAAAASERKNVRLLAPSFVGVVAPFLGLLNRQYFNGFRNLLTKPRDFEILPPHFWEDYPALLAVEGDTERLLTHAERLYRECRALWPFPDRATWQVSDLESALTMGGVPASGKLGDDPSP